MNPNSWVCDPHSLTPAAPLATCMPVSPITMYVCVSIPKCRWLCLHTQLQNHAHRIVSTCFQPISSNPCFQHLLLTDRCRTYRQRWDLGNQHLGCCWNSSCPSAAALSAAAIASSCLPSCPPAAALSAAAVASSCLPLLWFYHSSSITVVLLQ